MMSRPFSIRATAAVLLALAATGTASAQVVGPTPVAVATVVERDVPASLRLVGTVLPAKFAVVASEVSGPVARFAVAEGRRVKRGELICKIDATVAALRLAEAQARLASLQSRLKELENGTRAEDLRRLKAAVEEAQALFEKWDFERKRVAKLFEREQSNAKERHDTEMEYIAAARRLAQAQARYDLGVNGPRAEVIAQARHAVAAQNAVARRLEHELDKTEIKAPFDGFVVAQRTEVGEWIESGGPVCEMVAIDTVKIRADVPESAISFCRPGADATVEVEALGKTWAAKVARVIPRAAESARTFPIELDLPNEDHTLLPGMFVWVHVPSGPPGKRLVVSKDAIVADGSEKRVFVIRPGRGGVPMAMPTPVRTGLELQGEIEIHAIGIKAGDQVVTRANERLYGPTPVVIRGAATPPAEPDPPADRRGERRP